MVQPMFGIPFEDPKAESPRIAPKALRAGHGKISGRRPDSDTLRQSLRRAATELRHAPGELVGTEISGKPGCPPRFPAEPESPVPRTPHSVGPIVKIWAAMRDQPAWRCEE